MLLSYLLFGVRASAISGPFAAFSSDILTKCNFVLTPGIIKGTEVLIDDLEQKDKEIIKSTVLLTGNVEWTAQIFGCVHYDEVKDVLDLTKWCSPRFERHLLLRRVLPTLLKRKIDLNLCLHIRMLLNASRLITSDHEFHRTAEFLPETLIKEAVLFNDVTASLGIMTNIPTSWIQNDSTAYRASLYLANVQRDYIISGSVAEFLTSEYFALVSGLPILDEFIRCDDILGCQSQARGRCLMIAHPDQDVREDATQLMAFFILSPEEIPGLGNTVDAGKKLDSVLRMENEFRSRMIRQHIASSLIEKPEPKQSLESFSKAILVRCHEAVAFYESKKGNVETKLENAIDLLLNLNLSMTKRNFTKEWHSKSSELRWKIRYYKRQLEVYKRILANDHTII